MQVSSAVCTRLPAPRCAVLDCCNVIRHPAKMEVLRIILEGSAVYTRNIDVNGNVSAQLSFQGTGTIQIQLCIIRDGLRNTSLKLQNHY